MKQPKLNKKQKELFKKALKLSIDTALTQNVRLKKYMETRPTYLGSESWMEFSLSVYEKLLKVG